MRVFLETRHVPPLVVIESADCESSIPGSRLFGSIVRRIDTLAVAMG
jgi:hypothetical protein